MLTSVIVEPRAKSDRTSQFVILGLFPPVQGGKYPQKLRNGKTVLKTYSDEVTER